MRLALILITTFFLGTSCKTAKTIDNSSSNNPTSSTSASNGTIEFNGQSVPLQSTTSQRPEAPAKTDSRSYDNQYKEHAELNGQ